MASALYLNRQNRHHFRRKLNTIFFGSSDLLQVLIVFRSKSTKFLNFFFVCYFSAEILYYIFKHFFGIGKFTFSAVKLKQVPYFSRKECIFI